MSAGSHRVQSAAQRIAGVTEHLSTRERLEASYSIIVACLVRMPQREREASVLEMQAALQLVLRQCEEVQLLLGPPVGRA